MELRLLKCLKGQRSGVPPSLPSFPSPALFDAREMLFFRTLLGVRNVGLTLIIFCKSADISCTCKLAIEMLGSSYCILHIIAVKIF